MLPRERREKILADIAVLGVAQVLHLSEKYGVSDMTIRRDLKMLQAEGHIRRTHGGAVRRTSYPGESRIVAREKRQQLSGARKNAIARYAASLVADDDIIILEGGTTAATMIQFLEQREDLTVVTNGLDTVNELRRMLPPRSTILCAGGILRSESSTFVGPVAERFFREFHVQKLFLSATGLTLEAGVTDPSMLETQVKKAMIASASQVIMLLDSSKCGVKSLMTVLELDDIDVLVTDEGCPDEIVQGLRAYRMEVVVVPVT